MAEFIKKQEKMMRMLIFPQAFDAIVSPFCFQGIFVDKKLSVRKVLEF